MLLSGGRTRDPTTQISVVSLQRFIRIMPSHENMVTPPALCHWHCFIRSSGRQGQHVDNLFLSDPFDPAFILYYFREMKTS
jgi:hypothetical protein